MSSARRTAAVPAAGAGAARCALRGPYGVRAAWHNARARGLRDAGVRHDARFLMDAVRRLSGTHSHGAWHTHGRERTIGSTLHHGILAGYKTPSSRV